MVSLKRPLIVTAGLSAVGIVAGGLCAAIAVVIAVALDSGISGFPGAGSLWNLLRIAGVGAGIGSIAAPVYAWVVLRSVPLGPAAALTASETILGSIVGDRIAPINSYGTSYTPGILRGALIGFALAGLLARLVWSRARTAKSSAPAVWRTLQLTGDQGAPSTHDT